MILVGVPKNIPKNKSDWIESDTYTCAADAGIIDDSYIFIVLTYDSVDNVSTASPIRWIGRAVEKYANSKNNNIF